MESVTLVRLACWIPRALRTRLKLAAIGRNTTMQEFLVALLEKALPPADRPMQGD